MLRLIGFVILFPLLLVILWEDAPQWAIIGAWIVGGLVVVTPYLTGQLALKCPQCGKRIKVGYSTCHHCGYDVRATAGS